MKDKALRTIEKYKMLEHGDRVAVGLSGGADSVALLAFLCEIREEWNLTLGAVHMNHNLRGEESARDESFARKLCEDMQVGYYTESHPIEEIAKDKGLSIEECAREERYALFDRAVINGKIATAHTLSDSIETTIFNMTRGTGIQGLCGIPPVRGRIIRPLLGCTRGEIENYLQEREQEYVTDSSNLSLEYSRNRIRHEVVPVLTEINHNFSEAVRSMQQQLAEDAEFLDFLAEQALEGMTLEFGRFRRREYLRLPSALRGRVLKQLLVLYALPYDRRRMELLHQKISAGVGGVQLSPRLHFFVGEDEFCFEGPQDIEPYFQKEFVLPGEDFAKEISVFPGKTVQLSQMDYEEFENNVKSNAKLLKNALDYDKIGTIVTFRGRRPADRFRQEGRGCTKTLKQLFNEEKLSLAERSRIMVIEGGEELLWVEQFGACESAAVTPQTKKVLCISFG